MARYQQTWIYISTAIAILILLSLLLLLITIGIRKRSKKKSEAYVEETQVSNIERVFQTGFGTEDAEVQTCERQTPYVPRAHHPLRVSSSESECSSRSVTSSEELSPTLSQYNWKGKKRISPRKEYSIVPSVVDVGYRDVVDATNIIAVRKNSEIRSAHSYLSMPSVKNFPR